jgi:hypothetical protein
MRVPARRSTAESAHSAYDTDQHYGYGQLLPGERIGPPPARGHGKAMLRGVIIVTVLGGGWALLDKQSTLPRWLLTEIAAVSSSWEGRMRERVEPTASMAIVPAPSAGAGTTPKPSAPDASPSAAQPLPSSPAAGTSDVPPRSAAASPTMAAIPPPAVDADEPSAAPLPPPTVDPTDPYQKRAEAVGLHPDLSRVLLARLSPTDYRNADIAIRTALAETPDGSVFVWPRQRTPELALFQIRFVPGAAPGCRRYVVSVTKDGWLTTAPPMERCGAQPHRPQRS